MEKEIIQACKTIWMFWFFLDHFLFQKQIYQTIKNNLEVNNEIKLGLKQGFLIQQQGQPASHYEPTGFPFSLGKGSCLLRTTTLLLCAK